MLLLNVYQNIIQTFRLQTVKIFFLVLSKERIISHSLSTETEWMKTNVIFVRGIYLIPENCDELINKTRQRQVVFRSESLSFQPAHF